MNIQPNTPTTQTVDHGRVTTTLELPPAGGRHEGLSLLSVKGPGICVVGVLGGWIGRAGRC